MNNNRTRTIGIIIAVILGLAALLYLGGLVCQMLTEYQVWLAEGGMQGQAQIGDIRFGPLSCWRRALTISGLKYTGLVALIGGSVYVLARLYDRFGSRDFDDRNFARSQRGTYGTAGWMGETELRAVLEVASPQKARGIILGQSDRGSVICLPEDTRLNKHIAVFGASGTMKSRGVIRPALFQSIRRGESVVVTDPKSEIYSDTVELFRKHGYTVRVYNLLQPELSDSWNCMFDLGGDTLMAQVLTDVIIANTKGDSKGDHFWDNGEANLLKSLILYVDLDSTRRPEERNLPAVYQMLTQNTEKQLTALFDRLPLDHPARAPYSLFSQASDTVRAGVVLGLGTRLQVLQSEAVRSITRQSGIDLALPGQTKCAYYIILDDQNSSLEFLSSLFFAFLFIKLVRYADSTPEQRCPVPVNIVLDEMNNIGVIPDFSRRLSTIRSRALQVLMCCQNLPQIQNRYPNNLWAELVGNADTQLMLGCTDDVTAEYFSARSGDMTVEVNSTMTTRQSIAIAQVIPQYRYTQGLGRRRLLTPDEVLRLPNDQLLIIIRGQKVLRAKKFDYTGHPYAKECVKTSIRDYPSSQRGSAVESETVSEIPEPISDPTPEKPAPSAEPVPAPAAQAETHKRARRRPALYESAKPPSDF
ncbi:VirD4-like conjugal transfer protein, CD1115 family [uncultured Oscillibacter sp.]|uniref:VirD4-like conjugal transfer protein, CD1115 family n=1 Tax=uncultured Oscillibacter sp. TaxID=876091 RepID=UPI00260F6E8A|nr:type IV secretory system conjugative DNA transfer family protein [uncultured Oscillibacter sp.]